MDPELGVVDHGAELTCLGVTDHGAEVLGLRACLGKLHAALDPKKQLRSIFFLPNTTTPKTPDPPNPWI
jgi:hypothetical protein